MAALDGVNGTVCNAQQYQLSISSDDNPNPSISCLTHGQAIGLAVGILPLFCPFFELTLRTADSRSVVPEFCFGTRHICLDWCKLDFLLRLSLVV